MPSARRTALLLLITIGVLAPASAQAGFTTTVHTPPWESVSTSHYCAGPMALSQVPSSCEAKVTANARTGQTASEITTGLTEYGNTYTSFATSLPATPGAYSVRALAYLRIDRFEAGGPDDELIGQVWLGHPACDCYAWSGAVTLATGTRYFGGTTIGVDATLERPGQQNWRGDYDIFVTVTAATSGPRVTQAVPHTMRSTVTFDTIEMISER